MRAWLLPLLGVVAVGLAASSFVAPWWSVQGQGSFFQWPFSYTLQFEPLQWIDQSSSSGPGPNETTTQLSNYADQPEMASLFRVASVLDVAGTACGAAGVALVAVPRLRPSQRPGAPVLGALGFLFLVAAAFDFAILLPSAANRDVFPLAVFGGSPGPVVSGFWGTGVVSGPHSVASIAYGAGWGWYVLVAAGVVFLVDGILIVHRHRTHPWALLRRDN